VHVIDKVNVIFDFFILSNGDCVVFVGFEVSGYEYLVFVVELFTEDFVTLYEIFTYIVPDFILPLYSFIKEILEYMVVIRYVWVKLYSIRI